MGVLRQARILRRKSSFLSEGRREIFLVLIFGILWDGRGLEAAPLKDNDGGSEGLLAGLSSKKSQEAEVGNPSDLAWQAWLLVDGHPNAQPPPSGLDSASLLRRITPKSIFIAPALTACAEGYQADTMNRCVKDVSIDRQAHFGFLVERLNAKFGKPSTNNQPTGPLQLSIPLSLFPKPQEPETSAEVFFDPGPKKNAKIPDATEKSPEKRPDDRTESQEDAIVTVYKLKQDTKDEKDEIQFFLGNRTNENDDPQEMVSTDFKPPPTGPKGHRAPVSQTENSDSHILATAGIIDYNVSSEIDESPIRVQEIVTSGTLNYATTNDSDKNDSSSIQAIATSGMENLEIPNDTKKESSMSEESATSGAEEPKIGGDAWENGSETKDRPVDFRDEKNHQESINSTIEKEISSPTLVLVLTPTKLPARLPIDSSEIIVAHNSSLGQVVIKMENISDELGPREIISVSVPDEDPAESMMEKNTTKTMESPGEDRETDLISGDDRVNPSGPDATSEDYVNDRNIDDYDASTEVDDEILKHSEAGMTISTEKLPVKKIFLLPSMSQTGNETRDPPSTGSGDISSEVSITSDFVRETTLVDFNVMRKNVSLTTESDMTSGTQTETQPTTPTNLPETEVTEMIVESERIEETVENNRSENKSTVTRDADSSEATDKLPEIVDDSIPVEIFDDETIPKEDQDRREDEEIPDVEEATLESLDDSKGKKKSVAKKTVQAVQTVRGIEESTETQFPTDFSSTEKSDTAETMIAASTNVEDTRISEIEEKFETTTQKRGKPFKFWNEETRTTTVKIPASPGTQSQPGIFNYEPDYRPNRPNSHADQAPVIRTMDENLPYRPVSESISSNAFFPPHRDDYVKFPAYTERRHENRIRFPSEDANSITDEYKERNRRPYQQIYEPATREILPDRKESYWWLPNGWRNDRANSPQLSRTSQDQRTRDRTPMLLRFWNRMPLVRDPSMIYPTRGSDERRKNNSRMDSSAPRSSMTTSTTRVNNRRVTYYREMSNQDISRTFARHRGNVAD